MSKPYGIVADVHLHRWSAFAEVTHFGMNSRLAGLLAEITRAALMVKQEGGDTLIVAGDLFHVRGQIAPSVLNPTMDCFKALIDEVGMKIVILPGNHDLEGKHSDRINSAVTALEGVGCRVVHESTYLGIEGRNEVVVVPWFDKVEDLKNELLRLDVYENADLIIHAPVNGVIKGIPDHGLEPHWLVELGFNRVFSGHYHNHKSFGDVVYSIGALAHHSWSDVGSLAGFLLVYPDHVEHVESSLPKFVDVAAGMTVEDVTKIAPGNFVRAKINTSKLSDINDMRAFLEKAGARGSIVVSVKAPVEARDGAIAASVSAGASIERSVSDYVKTLKHMQEDRAKTVELEALRVLAEAEVA